MIISLVRLPTDGLKFEHRYSPGELQTADRDYVLVDQPAVVARVEKTGTGFRLRGILTARTAQPCDRCLADVELPMSIDFDLLYIPADPSPGRSGEIEIDSEDLGISICHNDEIDLDEMVLEQLELSIPLQVLCREDCRGLCAQCGVDRNLESCQCAPPADPRWEGIGAIMREGDEPYE